LFILQSANSICNLQRSLHAASIRTTSCLTGRGRRMLWIAFYFVLLLSPLHALRQCRLVQHAMDHYSFDQATSSSPPVLCCGSIDPHRRQTVRQTGEWQAMPMGHRPCTTSSVCCRCRCTAICTVFHCSGNATRKTHLGNFSVTDRIQLPFHSMAYQSQNRTGTAVYIRREQ